jgi:hypothetical protein
MIWDIQASRPTEKATDASALFSVPSLPPVYDSDEETYAYLPAVAENKNRETRMGA